MTILDHNLRRFDDETPATDDEGQISSSIPMPSTISAFDIGDDGVIRVSIQRRLSYAVVSARSPVFSPQSRLLQNLLRGRSVFFVVDAAVDARYGTELRSYAAKYLDCAGNITISPREGNKTLATVEKICRAADEAGLPRDGVLFGVGGGVTLDQAGLAASLYRRGILFGRLPTTLVGIVDVAVGIKQSVNHDRHKNLLGAFYPAFTNIIDLGFLASLAARDIASGIAEIAKMAIICDRRLFELLERHGLSLVRSKFQSRVGEEVISRAQLSMMDELCGNLYEEERARKVDLGHTFSPLLERRSDFSLAHGQAVAVDIIFSAAIACELGFCDSALVTRIVELFASVGLPTIHDALDLQLALDAIAIARKHRGKLNLVVPRDIGSVMFLQDVGKPILRDALLRVKARV
jgi:2-epi-5-epi-valiolone synthase